MLTKTCSKCLQALPLDRFGAGRSWCKQCISSYNHTYSQTRYLNDSDFKLKKIQNAKQWAKENPDARAVIAKRRNQKAFETDPEKLRRRASVNTAVKSGKLKPAKDFICVNCNSQQAVSYHHHKGYAFEHRLDVIPVCNPCHQLLDRTIV